MRDNANKLIAYQDEHGLTDQNMAKKADISITTYRRIRRMQQKPHETTINLLRESTGLDLEYCTSRRVQQEPYLTIIGIMQQTLLSLGILELSGDKLLPVCHGVPALQSCVARCLATLVDVEQDDTVSYSFACLTGAYRRERVDRYAAILPLVDTLIKSSELSSFADEVEAVINDLSYCIRRLIDQNPEIDDLQSALDILTQKKESNPEACIKQVYQLIRSNWYEISELEEKNTIMSLISVALDKASDGDKDRIQLVVAILMSFYGFPF